MSAPLIRLQIAQILPEDDTCFVVQGLVPKSKQRLLHQQDFPELIWVQSGEIRNHLPHGVQHLKAGDLAFVRVNDIHSLQGRTPDTQVVSICFDPQFVNAFHQRHAELGDVGFEHKGADPMVVTLQPDHLDTLADNVARLITGDRSSLETEAVLAMIMRDVQSTLFEFENLPDWLRDACIAAQNPEVFREGAAGLASASGRAHSHVSRTMRRLMGQSPSDYVNKQRMKFAARSLVTTQIKLSDLAETCGIPNLSHFHKLFRAQYGMTPQRYRKSHQRDVLRPE